MVVSWEGVPTSEKLQSPDKAPGFLDRDDALLADAAAVTWFCHKRGSHSTLGTAGYLWSSLELRITIVFSIKTNMCVNK